MSDQTQKVCPFSKPIIGRWCGCPHADLLERCSGKMACRYETKYHPICTNLVTILKHNASFILGITQQNSEHQPMTHSQAMKVRCGGILGMQRILKLETNRLPNIPDIISATESRYGDLQKFPYNEIIQDIKNFNHRKKSH